MYIGETMHDQHFLDPNHRLGEPPKKVAVFRALMLGDLLCAVPALRALRAALPQAQITLIGLPWASEFARRFSMYVDDFMEFPGYPGLPERDPQIDKIPGFFAEAQARKFDLAVQLHGSGSYANSVTVMLGAKRNTGFYAVGDYTPDSELFMPYPDRDTEIWRFLRLMKFIGVPSKGDHLEFPVSPGEAEALNRMPEAARLAPYTYVCIHPGARLLSRRWGAARFAAVADALSQKGLTVALTGSQTEIPLVAEVQKEMRFPSVNLAGRTSLGVLAALISRSRMLISNDTGVSHIAAAVKTPSVIVVTGSDPERWAPLDHELHRVVFSGPLDCRPCSYVSCPFGMPCASGVSPEHVLSQVRDLLADVRSRS
jgi:ADP-heptose:LPS heptosyltransferase